MFPVVEHCMEGIYKIGRVLSKEAFTYFELSENRELD